MDNFDPLEEDVVYRRDYQSYRWNREQSSWNFDPQAR